MVGTPVTRADIVCPEFGLVMDQPDGEDPPVLLRLVRRRQSVMCLVADPSDRPPVLAEADFAAETGRGLYLVDAHSRRWDWAPRRDRPGKWVWALLPPPADASR
jgi:hypothetical protein